MGLYDCLKGRCPDCGRDIRVESGDVQIKWFVGAPSFSDCFRTFRPGDKLPVKLLDGEYLISKGGWRYCACESASPLFAVVRRGRFMGFTRNPQGAAWDINVARHEIKISIDSGTKHCSDKP